MMHFGTKTAKSVSDKCKTFSLKNYYFLNGLSFSLPRYVGRKLEGQKLFCIIGLEVGMSFCFRTHFSIYGIKILLIGYSLKTISTWQQPTEIGFFFPSSQMLSHKINFYTPLDAIDAIISYRKMSAMYRSVGPDRLLLQYSAMLCCATG
jgi:hypothetical protein